MMAKSFKLDIAYNLLYFMEAKKINFEYEVGVFPCY